ncbi:MAG: hypothetical protein EAX86_09220 [Candidatus Heimdallarchaeota archaeon]|nr:hypothetical protein [Candidatus Heimdallarchaeota archaeon]
MHGDNDEIIFELQYNEKESINITSIEIWQTLHFYNSYWNVTTRKTIEIPDVPLSQGDQYYFLASGLFIFIDQGKTFTQGPFYAKIIVSDVDYWITLESFPDTIQEVTEANLLPNTQLSERISSIRISILLPSISFLALRKKIHRK